jgi:hypothetical protein
VGHDYDGDNNNINMDFDFDIPQSPLGNNADNAGLERDGSTDPELNQSQASSQPRSNREAPQAPPPVTRIPHPVINGELFITHFIGIRRLC